MKKVGIGIACAIFWVMAILPIILLGEYEWPDWFGYLNIACWAGGIGTSIALLVMTTKRMKVGGIACGIFWVMAILPIIKWGWAYMPDWIAYLDMAGWMGGIGTSIALIAMAIKRRKGRK